LRWYGFAVGFGDGSRGRGARGVEVGCGAGAEALALAEVPGAGAFAEVTCTGVAGDGIVPAGADGSEAGAGSAPVAEGVRSGVIPVSGARSGART
jgi:hypothetical protein